MLQVHLKIADRIVRRHRFFCEKSWWLERRANVAVTQVGNGVVEVARRTVLIDLQSLLGVEKINARDDRQEEYEK
jgi:hypothetical protein